MAKKPKKEAPEGEEGAPAPEPAAKKGGSRKKLVLASVAAIVLIAATGGGYVLMHRKSDGKEATAALRKPVAFVDIREMTINLAPEPNDARSRFLKFRVALELNDPKIIPEIQPLLPRVEDTFQVFVRELRASDLEGSSGVYRLREELLRRVNIAHYPAKVDAVLFNDIVVQ